MKKVAARWSGALACVVCTLAAGACVDVRERPSDPSAPEPTSSVPLSFVRITHPVEGQSISRVAISQEPGFQVTFTGRFRAGDDLLLLVFSDEFPSRAIFAAQAEVEEVGDETSSSARIVLPSTNVILANELEIMLRILSEDDELVFTDSVGVVLQ